MVAALASRLEFAPMTEADLEAVVLAEQRSYDFPWSRGNFADSLKAGHSAWVAWEGDRLVGHGLLLMAVDEAQLLNITVIPERQGQGLGRELLDHLLAVARRHGAVRMILEVRPSNVAGLGLYRCSGFTQIGRRRGYYAADGGREDAIVMARDL